MIRSVSAPINLSDPSFEPSDEDLVGLSVRAFAGVRAAHERSMAKLSAEFAAALVEALRLIYGRCAKTAE